MPQEKKSELYNKIKVLGVATFIPITLAIGPLTGFFLGNYLIKRFSLPVYIMFICITLGFLSSVLETIRLIKFMFKEGKV